MCKRDKVKMGHTWKRNCYESLQASKYATKRERQIAYILIIISIIIFLNSRVYYYLGNIDFFGSSVRSKSARHALEYFGPDTMTYKIDDFRSSELEQAKLETNSYESPFKSIGEVEPFVGPIDDVNQFITAMEKRSKYGEIILTVSDIKRADMLFNFFLTVESFGYEHHGVITLYEEECRVFETYWPQLGCMWSPDIIDMGPLDSPLWHKTRIIWLSRWLIVARAVQLELNVLLVDTDNIMLDDIYKYVKSQPFNYANLIAAYAKEDNNQPGVNCGLVYVQNAAPDGPTGYFGYEVARRTLTYLEDPQAVLDNQQRFANDISWLDFKALYEQELYNDAICSAINGRDMYRTTLNPNNIAYPEEYDLWEQFHKNYCKSPNKLRTRYPKSWWALTRQEEEDIHVHFTKLPAYSQQWVDSLGIKPYPVHMPGQLVNKLDKWMNKWQDNVYQSNLHMPIHSQHFASSQTRDSQTDPADRVAMFKQNSEETLSKIPPIETGQISIQQLAQVAGSNSREVYIPSPDWLLSRWTDLGQRGGYNNQPIPVVIAHFVSSMRSDGLGKYMALRLYGWWYGTVDQLLRGTRANLPLIMPEKYIEQTLRPNIEGPPSQPFITDNAHRLADEEILTARYLSVSPKFSLFFKSIDSYLHLVNNMAKLAVMSDRVLVWPGVDCRSPWLFRIGWWEKNSTTPYPINDFRLVVYGPETEIKCLWLPIFNKGCLQVGIGEAEFKEVLKNYASASTAAWARNTIGKSLVKQGPFDLSRDDVTTMGQYLEVYQNKLVEEPRLRIKASDLDRKLQSMRDERVVFIDQPIQVVDYGPARFEQLESRFIQYCSQHDKNSQDEYDNEGHLWMPEFNEESVPYEYPAYAQKQKYEPGLKKSGFLNV